MCVFLDHCLFLHPDKLEISHPAFHMKFESVNSLIFPNTWIISRTIVDISSLCCQYTSFF